MRGENVMPQDPSTSTGAAPAEGAKNGRRRRLGIAARYEAWCVAAVRVLPFGLSSRVAPTFLGFALINGFTFAVDLLLLTLLHGVWAWPLPLAITVSYACAFALSFLLNRTLNFRSHGFIGRQTVLYLGVIAVNYVAFILGVGSGLTALGVPYQFSRLIAGACEGIFMYCAMRWVVFAKRNEPRRAATLDGR